MLAGFSGAGFSLWVLVLARTNPHRLKPAPPIPPQFGRECSGRDPYEIEPVPFIFLEYQRKNILWNMERHHTPPRPHSLRLDDKQPYASEIPRRRETARASRVKD